MESNIKLFERPLKFTIRWQEVTWNNVASSGKIRILPVLGGDIETGGLVRTTHWISEGVGDDLLVRRQLDRELNQQRYQELLDSVREQFRVVCTQSPLSDIDVVSRPHYFNPSELEGAVLNISRLYNDNPPRLKLSMNRNRSFEPFERPLKFVK
jgi:hypothetical protein